MGGGAPRPRAAFVASLLLHVLGAVALLMLPVSPPAPSPLLDLPPSAAEIAIEIAETPPPEAGEPAPPSPAPEPPSRPRRRAPPAPAAPPVAPAAPPVPPGQEATAPSPAPAAPPAPPPVNLSLDTLALGARERVLGGPVGGDELPVIVAAPRRKPGARFSVDELRAEAEQEADAIANVRKGRAHPVLFDVLRGARARLEPDALRMAEALPLGPGLSTKGWIRGYTDRLKKRPGARGERSERAGENPMGEGGSDLFPAYDEMERQAAGGAERRTARVCVAVAPGQAPAVLLRRSSGHAELDRLAVQSFERAGAARPVPTDVRAGLACYMVQISAFRMPPLPTLSLGWNKGPQVIYPLKKITKLTVQLESVDHGRRPGTGPRLLGSR